MRLSGLAFVTVLVGLVAGDAVSDLAAKGRLQINDYVANNSKTCTPGKLSVRREWGDISKPERRAYIDAVLCLIKAPSKLDSKQFPGAKSRYDDFVVVHMNQTLSIHGTGNFLSWHRYYIWSWENVLKKECGFKGTLPYWDYGRWYKDPLSSPIFDGSDTSLGGNGAPSIQRAATQGSASSKTTTAGHTSGTSKPGGSGVGAGTGSGTGWGGMGGGVGMPGMGETTGGFGGGFGGASTGMGSGGVTGGGCVTTGPFKNMTINLGPMSPVATPNPPRNPMGNGYGANPRCLRRDITNTLGMLYGKPSDIATLISAYTKILDFQNYMQSGSGIHGVGHFTVSGDPGGDFYISPNEPSFWIHHAMIDRTWVIWQSLDYKNRMMQMEGGTSMMGFSAKQQSLDDLVDLGVVGDKVYKIRDLLSSVDGPFCYVYE